MPLQLKSEVNRPSGGRAVHTVDNVLGEKLGLFVQYPQCTGELFYISKNLTGRRETRSAK